MLTPLLLLQASSLSVTYAIIKKKKTSTININSFFDLYFFFIGKKHTLYR